MLLLPVPLPRTMPRIPTLKNLEDLVTEYQGNFLVRTWPEGDCSLSTADWLSARQTEYEGGGRGRGPH